SQLYRYAYSTAPPYGSWSDASSLGDQGRAYMAGAVMANGAVLVGSALDNFQNYTTDASLFDPKLGSLSTTSTNACHAWGGAATVIRSDSTAQTLVVGGYDDALGFHGETDVFILTDIGGTCTVGPECATGACVSGTCQTPPQFPITINATALTHKGLLLVGGGNAVLDT